jgi:hypothetical protein
MKYTDLLQFLGFEADPFAKTNADEEDRLEKYFVAPPFFNAVYGDPKEPKSAVVFAPRGGGKTALKRKIEVASQDGNFVCVTYNTFDVGSRRLEEVTSDFHLHNIVEVLTVAILGAAAVRESNLTSDEKHILYLFIKQYLSGIDQTRLREDINSVKNLSDKAKEIWNSLTGPIGFALSAIFANFGIDSADVSKFEAQAGKLGSYKLQLESLAKLAYRLGYPSVYVLIDRVDETPLTTNSADGTNAFIRPLLSDLHLLELPRFAFKFFLWDLLASSYQQSGGRPDRVKTYTLRWTYQQLADMLSQRLKAHSGGRVGSLQEICDASIGRPLDEVVAIFAQGSPRNVVRICKEILDQQSEIDAAATKISDQAIRFGFDRISHTIAGEMFEERVVQDLQRCRRCDFTIRFISSEIFKFTPQAGTNKVRNWENSGAVIQVGQIIESKGNKPSVLYGVDSLFLAKHIFAKLPIGDFLNAKVRTCPSCQVVVVRDWDLRAKNQCQSCQHEFSAQ